MVIILLNNDDLNSKGKLVGRPNAEQLTEIRQKTMLEDGHLYTKDAAAEIEGVTPRCIKLTNSLLVQFDGLYEYVDHANGRPHWCCDNGEEDDR